ncbi:MAG: hypothetical protein PVI91_00150 [Gammaproteobacteria bacterium]|jgi:hypothetical protein
MQENRALIVHFNDATTLSFIFPGKADGESVADKIKQVLSAEQVVIEADGSLFIIPQSSIKYMQAYPAPSSPAENVISGATLTGES